jgi:5-oxoprolinase (ATP-hydrolysing)
MQKWHFHIDRGGTFTDVIAISPKGEVLTRKFLSENPDEYRDAALHGMRELMGVDVKSQLNPDKIAAIKMGTTVATNALLERKGEPTVLLTNRGFEDALRIAYQNRPQIFAREIKLPEILYDEALGISARFKADGTEVSELDEKELELLLRGQFTKGYRSLAVALMHAYLYPEHELRIGEIAREIGFEQISLSHETAPVIKIVSRGQTTVVDAYLTPVIRRYVSQLKQELQRAPFFFMQSNGGLIAADEFQGKNAVLSGPAGGVVGAVKTARAHGYNQVIGFDMGGTSTDVFHYAGEYERSPESKVAGIHFSVPMMDIHTIAAGGGSLLSFDGMRFRVGPESAGANPGPRCYRRKGPLTVTDANVLLGKIQAEHFPAVFGEGGHEKIDTHSVRHGFEELAAKISKDLGKEFSPKEVAEGFIDVAVQNMARAIKKITIERGHDPSEYVLNSFGGAGGQHACLVAESLGIKNIFIHDLASVLSAYGIGQAEQRILKDLPVQELLEGLKDKDIDGKFKTLTLSITQSKKHAPEWLNAKIVKRAFLHYPASDTSLPVLFSHKEKMLKDFHEKHLQLFGFNDELGSVAISNLQVEASLAGLKSDETYRQGVPPEEDLTPVSQASVFSHGKEQGVSVYLLKEMPEGLVLQGPALILHEQTSIMVEPNWQAKRLQDALLLSNNEKIKSLQNRHCEGPAGARQSRDNRRLLDRCVGRWPSRDDDSSFARPDPIQLEIFNNLFMSVAEQMGVTLQRISHSVNIKERLDFSCALFDGEGCLVANAPHIPVHLGSMGDAVKVVKEKYKDQFKPGDAIAHNNPYEGGTHLPDITVISPVFDEAGEAVLFFVAARGHHADVGGMTPGSMPALSQHIGEEGILLEGLQIAREGKFQEKIVREAFKKGDYPARDVELNLADLKAQVAANERGNQELKKMLKKHGADKIKAYMRHVQDNAEEAVRKAICQLKDGEFSYTLDQGAKVVIKLTVDAEKREAEIDFTGSSAQQQGNLNAPFSVCKAAVLYVFRTLVDDDIPLNEGCFRPLHITMPEDCFLNPQHPAAVVAGNVETSQYITDALFGAMGIMAASQGTMNNLSFGSERYQYYETICGGAGAGKTYDGASAVQTHMTNSRLTDAEVLETRYPLYVDEFSIRKGSGGSGLYKGGDGVVRKLKFLEPMQVSLLSEHRVTAPFGLRGGKDGLKGENKLVLADGEIRSLAGVDQFEVKVGDSLVIATPGGGGFGDEK